VRVARVVRKEIRKRGFFGWVFLIIFLGYNAIMLAWLIAAIAGVSNLDPAQDEFEDAGRAIGGAIGFSFIGIVWLIGALITGLLALLTRGGKTVVIEE
jgi:hypothetical protein